MLCLARQMTQNPTVTSIVINRCVLSTNHKDIGLLYLLLSLIADFSGTSSNVLTNLELAVSG